MKHHNLYQWQNRNAKYFWSYQLGQILLSHRICHVPYSECTECLLDIPHINSKFSSEKSRRFLMHLIGHHDYTLEHNSTVSGSRYMSNMNSMFEHMEPVYSSSQIGLITRYFKHSCAPNLSVSTLHGNTIFTTVRPIKMGDQLMCSYLLIMTESTENRQKALWDRKRLICTCSLCNGVTASTAQLMRLISDPDFQYIVSNFTAVDKNDQALQTITVLAKIWPSFVVRGTRKSRSNLYSSYEYSIQR